jgi:hypothetical protein
MIFAVARSVLIREVCRVYNTFNHDSSCGQFNQTEFFLIRTFPQNTGWKDAAAYGNVLDGPFWQNANIKNPCSQKTACDLLSVCLKFS